MPNAKRKNDKKAKDIKPQFNLFHDPNHQHNFADNEQQFVQNLISGALRQLADQVERPTRGEPGSEHSPMDFWTEAIRIGLDNLL